MSTVLVTFIGKGNYQCCKYVYRDSVCETHLFGFALASFFTAEISKVVVFHTEESKEAKRENDDKTYIEQLKELHLENDLPEPEAVLIKSGKSEDELWEIFDTLSSVFDEDDEIIFDITHAFRSIPILSLLVIALLRETKNVKLKGIFYGAFEAKDENGNTPIFDLSPFVELLDWISAAKQFNTTGNAALLVELLKIKDKNLATDIENLSRSLRLLRPVDVMELSGRVSKKITNEKSLQHVKSKPIFQLLESIDESYSRFSLSNPKENKEKFIKKLFEMAKWYFDKGQYVQSIAVIRELMPTVVCYKMELDFFKHRGNREKAEGYLNQHDEDKNKILFDRSENDLLIKMKELWKEITGIRNDVLHAGFNENSAEANTLVKKNCEFLKKTEEIIETLSLR
jgi:CRISPR-associated Csx2 family protein